MSIIKFILFLKQPLLIPYTLSRYLSCKAPADCSFHCLGEYRIMLSTTQVENLITKQKQYTGNRLLKVITSENLILGNCPIYLCQDVRFSPPCPSCSSRHSCSELCSFSGPSPLPVSSQSQGHGAVTACILHATLRLTCRLTLSRLGNDGKKFSLYKGAQDLASVSFFHLETSEQNT